MVSLGLTRSMFNFKVSGHSVKYVDIFSFKAERAMWEKCERVDVAQFNIEG